MTRVGFFRACVLSMGGGGGSQCLYTGMNIHAAHQVLSHVRLMVQHTSLMRP